MSEGLTLPAVTVVGAETGKVLLQKYQQTDQQSKPVAPTGKLEYRLHKKDLKKLQDAFLIQGDGYENHLSLNKEQFSEALSLLLNKGTKEEYTELFEKIDVTGEGYVDWDKFASYMLLEFYEREDRAKATQIPQWKDLRYFPSPHKQMIQRIVYLKNAHRYLAISKEGCVSVWNNVVQLQRTVKLTTESCRNKDLWVTHFTPMQDINKLAVTYTSKEIMIYDLSNKIEFNCQYKIKGLKHTPLCLDYWSSNDHINEAFLAWGDVGGFVNILHFTSINIVLFERPSAPTEDGNETWLTILLTNVQKGIFRNVSYTKYQAHTDWVHQVFYSHYLDCFISCSTYWKNALVLGWMEKHAITAESLKKRRDNKNGGRKIQRMSVFQISQGLNAFCYSTQFNLIATAGVNHHVGLWNPYVKSKPNGILCGHMSSVVQVQILTSRSLLFSFSKDKVLRIWDIQLQVCLQRLAGLFPKGEDMHITILLDEITDHKDQNVNESTRMFLTFGSMLTMIEMKSERRDRVISHEVAVMAAVYCSYHNQVISVSQCGVMTFWMVDSGQKVKQLNKIHDNAEVMCLTLQEATHRLYTGATDGTVKVWDFNGHCYHKLICANGQPAKIGQVFILKRCVLVVGWGKYLTIFRDSDFKDFVVYPSEWKGNDNHTDDILSLAFSSPNLLITGAYNGEIFLWDTKSEKVIKYLRQQSKTNSHQMENSFLSEEMSNPCESFNSSICDVPDRSKSRLSSRTSKNENDDQNEFGLAVMNLNILESRNNLTTTAANLISCGGNGYVRFWNTQNCILMAEFVAHADSGSITMNVGVSDNYLVTGDVEGWIKVWNIKEYCLDFNDEIIMQSPALKTKFKPHIDMINSLYLFERNQNNLILSASSDCSVVLSDIGGHTIGIFGQEDHWKIEPYREPTPEPEPEPEPTPEPASPAENTSIENPLKPLEDQMIPSMTKVQARQEEETLTDLNSFHWNTWEKTLLGKGYQETRTKKRCRRQPAKLDHFSSNWDKAGPYSVLAIPELDVVQTVVKPDLNQILRPPSPVKQAQNSKVTSLAQSLKAAFDEKTLFSKYIIESEQRVKQFHQELLKEDALQSTKAASKSKNSKSATSNKTASAAGAAVSATTGTKLQISKLGKNAAD